MDLQERRRMRLLVRRLEFGLPRESWKELYEFCVKRQMPEDELFSIIKAHTFNPEDVCKKLISLWKEHEGTRSEPVQKLWRLGIGIKKEMSAAGEKDGIADAK